MEIGLCAVDIVLPKLKRQPKSKVKVQNSFGPLEDNTTGTSDNIIADTMCPAGSAGPGGCPLRSGRCDYYYGDGGEFSSGAEEAEEKEDRLEDQRHCICTL